MFYRGGIQKILQTPKQAAELHDRGRKATQNKILMLPHVSQQGALSANGRSAPCTLLEIVH